MSTSLDLSNIIKIVILFDAKIKNAVNINVYSILAYFSFSTSGERGIFVILLILLLISVLAVASCEGP